MFLAIRRQTLNAIILQEHALRVHALIQKNPMALHAMTAILLRQGTNAPAECVPVLHQHTTVCAL